MQRFIFLTLDGLSHGAVYAAFALALVIIHRSTRVVNFSQGALAVTCAYTGYSVAAGSGSYWLGFAAALASGLVIGAILERVVMRPVEHGPPLNPVIVALGMVLVIQAVLGMIYGNDFKPLPTPFSRAAWTINGVAVLSPYDLFVFGAVFLLMLGLALLFNRTKAGLRMRASAFAPEMSRLLGVNVNRMLTLGWSLAAAAGALAALLVIPTELGLNPNAMDLVFVSSFTAAVVGGIDSPIGAVIGGIGVGLVLSYVTGYSSSDVTPIAVLVLLVAVLLLRPAGLFSSTRTRQV